ncbi:MAG TPA: class I SAM-dependent methyltransferase [Ilumatobacteraceae bacterium]|nr:class I SAM-dependent methyltransferase [Ilumatobacteraceae bacterium]
MSERSNHWDDIYATRPSTELSWHQGDPQISLRLIEQITHGQPAVIIDIGAGTSLLVDQLVACRFTDVTVIDVSDLALAVVRQRLGAHAKEVTFVPSDITTWTPDRRYDIWHDRAVFHFLTEQTDRDRYVAIASDAVRGGGSVVLATFAEDGPTRCSGLPVCRYTADELATVFSPAFSLIEHEREEHVTPSGINQSFTWVVLQRT